MKKRILAVLTVILTILGMTACSTGVSLPSISKEDVPDMPEVSVSVSPASESAEVEHEIEPEPADDNSFALIAKSYRKVTYLDNDGKAAVTYDFSDKDGEIAEVIDDNVIFIEGRFDGDIYEYHATAYNVVTKESKEIWKSEDYIKTDSYDGVLYLCSYSYNDNHYTEAAFDAQSFKEIDNSKNQKLYDALDGYTLMNSEPVSGNYYNYTCVQRIFDKVGFALVADDTIELSTVYKFDGKKTEAVSLPVRAGSIEAYDKNFVYYTDYDTSDLISFDYKDKYCVMDEKINSVMAFEDGVLYWSEMDPAWYGAELVALYSFDENTGKTDLIATPQKHAGMTKSVIPGVTGFTVAGDCVYYIADDSVKTEWYRIVPDDTFAYIIEPIGEVLQNYDFLRYGKVKYVNDVFYCPYCNEAVGKGYIEYFELNDNVSPNAAKINETLADAAKNTLESFIEHERLTIGDESLCKDYHGEYYSVTYQNYNVNDVYTVGENYISIDMDGYWYGGGAHDLPIYSFNLFDLTTGEQVGIRDLFKGSEEDLKKAVAENTKKLAEEQIEDYGYSVFFAADAEGVYKDAYEYITFDNFEAMYGTDSLTCVIPPYALAPYAAGIIEVKIPYSELGIKLD